MPFALPALGVIAAFCVLIALSYAYKSSVGALLAAIANAIHRLPHVNLGFTSLSLDFLGNAIGGLDNEIRDALAAGIQGTEWAWHQLVHFVAHQFQSIGHTIEAVAVDAEAALAHLRKTLLPAAITVALSPLAAGLGYLLPTVRQLVRDVTHLIEHPTRPLVKVIHEAAQAAPAVVKNIYVSVPAVAAKAVAVPRELVRGIDETLKETQARVGRLARLLAPAGIAGLLLGGLAAVGLGWLKCSKVGRVGKAICGISENELESLLAGALVLASTISVVEFAESCQAFTTEADDALRFFVRELRDVAPVKAVKGGAALKRYVAGSY